jgi:hypothetical protein
MTLPTTPFVCENIDVEAGTRHWVEEIEGDCWEDIPPTRRMGLMQVAEAIVAAALGEVIPAEVETKYLTVEAIRSGRYVTEWMADERH